jgi:hypothetical protein
MFAGLFLLERVVFKLWMLAIVDLCQATGITQEWLAEALTIRGGHKIRILTFKK